MKKFLVTGFLALLLTGVLSFAALADTGVDKGGSAPRWTYTATLDGEDADTPATITAGDMYLLVVIRTSSLEGGGFPSSLSADDILYIDQKTADASDASDEGANSIVFANFIPMNYTGGTAFLTGGSLGEPVALGTLENLGIWGDVNEDFVANATDAVLVLRHSSGIIELNSNVVIFGDVNGDTNTNATDAVLILRKSSGIISSFPVE
ncbi:MAG TPA: dockerin type I repeat-containing protein [Candidatus Acidoferrum sp.]|nr:dockerin type I repeat-containing protein [Candidatus Acidoferrum sp.]